jgi:4-hydroxythreonine-4-phosphate dehydrogenase
MNIEIILIVLGEPFSTFSEILGKYFSSKNILKKKIILIGNIRLFKDQMKSLKYKFPLNEIDNYENAELNKINIINVDFKYKKVFSKISSKSKTYIENCFNLSLSILKKNSNKCSLINGPISKKYFLKNKHLGITEYLSDKTGSKDEVMLIYNKSLSVSPITTHIPLKYVTKKINKNKIIKNVLKINFFYNKILNKKIKFAVLGLNPHCETIDSFSEEDKILVPAIYNLKKRGIKIEGPFPADTFFIKKNLKKYNVVIGMYHDQVLTPIKTIYNFHAINITLGLPFIRISPDHGPNSSMIGKNLSDPSSFKYAMKFLQNLK